MFLRFAIHCAVGNFATALFSGFTFAAALSSNAFNSRMFAGDNSLHFFMKAYVVFFPSVLPSHACVGIDSSIAATILSLSFSKSCLG